jgi:hypothetical protein
MRRFRAPAAVGVALLFLVLTAGPAFAPWKGLSDLNFDDGRMCRDGINFALADFTADNEHATVTNVTADPDIILADDVTLAQLHFAPVPERFFLGDYYFSANYRIPFPKVPIGTDLTIDFTGSHITSTNLPPVGNCRLGQPVSGFIGLSNPPDVNTVTTPDPIALEFSLPGRAGPHIFSERPTYAPIPCAPGGANPGSPDPAPPRATGTLSFDKSSGTYTYLWTPPTGLKGCQEVWFRLKRDGLQHRVMFDFGP